MDESHNELDIRIFDPVAVRVFRTDGDSRVRLTIEGDRSYVEVRIGRAFPFSDPGHYVGFRDSMDHDIGLVAEPERLDKVSIAVIDAELERRYFTPKVKKVVSVKEEHGAVIWELITDRGPRRVVIRNIRDNAFPIGANRLILTDPDGNRVEFADIERYGQKAYQILAKVM